MLERRGKPLVVFGFLGLLDFAIFAWLREPWPVTIGSSLFIAFGPLFTVWRIDAMGQSRMLSGSWREGLRLVLLGLVFGVPAAALILLMGLLLERK